MLNRSVQITFILGAIIALGATHDCMICDEYIDYDVHAPQTAVDVLNRVWAREFGLIFNPTSQYEIYYVMDCQLNENGQCLTELKNVIVDLCETPLDGPKNCFEMSIHKASIETYKIVSQFIGRIPRYESMHIMI